jgi:hypothetical protein
MGRYERVLYGFSGFQGVTQGNDAPSHAPTGEFCTLCPIYKRRLSESIDTIRRKIESS